MTNETKKLKTKTIYLTQEDVDLKKKIEEKLNGAKLTLSTIYRRGLDSFNKDLEEKVLDK